MCFALIRPSGTENIFLAFNWLAHVQLTSVRLESLKFERRMIFVKNVFGARMNGGGSFIDSMKTSGSVFKKRFGCIPTAAFFSQIFSVE
jgi:hypothetical protein